MKERILVVDDNHEAADTLVRLLISLGYEAQPVYDGLHAVDVAAAFLPDLLFIDIGMPGLDGNETVKRIRRHKECAHAILIALTAYTTSQDKQKAYAAGFDLHVSKPMGMDALNQVLKLLDPSATSSTEDKIHRLERKWDRCKTA